jgi:glycosyltransferase involved in cell wall biosynthesis
MVTAEPKRSILIDGHNLGLEKGTGIATYARNLSYALRDMGRGVDVLYATKASSGYNSILKEIAFFDPLVGELPLWIRSLLRAERAIRSPFGMRAIEVPIEGRVIADQYKSRLPYFDRIVNIPDVFDAAYDSFFLWNARLRISIPRPPSIAHWTFPIPMFIPGAKNIYTLHDLVPLRLPYTTLDNKRRYYRLISLLLKKADHIVTVSETSKRDICNIFGFPEEKITNTYQSVHIPDRYRNKPEVDVRNEVEGTFRLKFKEYFLFFGAIEPKKNIARLIEGYLASNVSTPLVIVGSAAWKSEQELRLLSENSIRYLERVDNNTFVRDRIRRIEYAPFPLLVSLIRGAKAVLFPSLFEGFGLPVLESMLLGTPVLSSTGGSIPEVAGDAAILVDPYDPRAIASAIAQLDSDAALRLELASRGTKQAALFSDERFRRKLTEVYASLEARGDRRES